MTSRRPDEIAALLATDATGGLVDLSGPANLDELRRVAAEAGARFAVLDGPTSKADLLAALHAGLELPDYFGFNWDALEEVLGSPEPAQGDPILLVWLHQDRLDAADPDTGRIFRAVVTGAAANRATRGNGPMVVVTANHTEQMFGSPRTDQSMHNRDAMTGRHEPSRVHHVAVVVRDLEAALGFYRDTLRLDLDLVMPIESDGVRIAFLPVGESSIELVQPTRKDTGVARFLDNNGEGFHHVCLEVDDIAAELARLGDRGVELIDTAPRRGAEGPVAFIHPRSCHGVLVELIEAPGGPAWKTLGYD